MTAPVDAADAFDLLADLIAERVVARLRSLPRAEPPGEMWLDTRAAAAHVGVHPDTLRKLAAAGRVPYEQEAPRRKLYFRRSDLDRLRAGGFHAASMPPQSPLSAGDLR